MNEFDPYHKWLGIPPDEQPPNHYRLLGITVFESDPDVIEAAADRQMTYVSQCATGIHLKLSQQLLNELSGARVCLLVAAKKKVYDADLKVKLSESRRIESSMVPVVLTEPQASFSFPPLEADPQPQQRKPRTKPRSSKRSKSVRRSARPQRSIGMVAAIVAGLILGAVGLRSMFIGRQDTSPKLPIAQHSMESTNRPEPTATIPAKPDAAVSPHVSETVPIAEIHSGNGAFQDDVESLKSQSSELRDAFAAAKDSRDKLVKSPEDPAANLAWGRFVCFYKQDWDSGLRLLAKSNDAVWAPLARKELNPPTTANEWIALGDAWIQAGARESNTIQCLTAQRADQAWQQALILATQLSDKEIEQKVDQRTVDLFGKSFVVTKGDSAGATIAGSDLYSPTDSFTIEFWVSTSTPIGTLLSKRHAFGEPSIIVHVYNGIPNLSIAIGAVERGSGGGSTIDDGKWHHIALVKRQNQIALFIDGNKSNQTTEETEMNSASPWKFGCSHGRPSCAARFGGIRISKIARYDEPFVPKKRHLRDNDTLLE